MDNSHPAYTPRRASSTLPRPRPKERTMTSSSTGSVRLQNPSSSQRRNSIPARPAHVSHRDSATSYRSQRESFSTETFTRDALSEGESMEGEEEWERGETVGEIKRRKKKDEPMSPVTVVRKSSTIHVHLSSLLLDLLHTWRC